MTGAVPANHHRVWDPPPSVDPTRYVSVVVLGSGPSHLPPNILFRRFPRTLQLPNAYNPRATVLETSKRRKPVQYAAESAPRAYVDIGHSDGRVNYGRNPPVTPA
jgi:hypothetical protein